MFSVWKAHEGADPVWQEFAKKEKGWGSWEEWRSNQSEFINAQDREWKLYEIRCPNELIPKFRIGPFNGWQKHFEKKNVYTFEDLVQRKTEWVLNNIGVQARRNNFPKSTQFIGFYLEDDDVVVLFEGHHRAAAVALAAYEKNPIQFEINPTIALTILKGDQTEFFDQILQHRFER